MISEKTLLTLEYDKILSKLSSYTQSEGALLQAQKIRPSQNITDAEKSLAETAEADKVLFEYALSPSFAVDDISAAVTLASKFAILSISDILKVGRCLGTSRRIKTLLSKAQNIPLLSHYGAMLYSDQKFEDSIFSAFLTENEVSDNASNNLKQIRSRIRKKNAAIKSSLTSYISSPQYSKILQDNIVTIRSDRYVIPVKSEFRGSISGLVHDQSASGSTVYIEPMPIVEMNNELKGLLSEEKAEIEKILRDFSQKINAIGGFVSLSYMTVISLDLIFSKAQMARALRASRPVINNLGLIDIANGRHPLLDAKTVVPVSVKITKDTKMLLITGPNTGGKTVTLKLIGLFCVMAMSGMFVPSSNAEISVFDNIYCDIGDEQSIEQSLSTFSGHIKNIIGITEQMTQNSLLLLDELGAGTDPSEGAALAVSIAKFILDNNVKAVITSHFNDLKEFALTDKRIATASMDFDSRTFAPTYKLVMGAIGSSNALRIAERLGLKKEIILDAKGRISSEKLEFDNILRSAEDTRKHAESIISEAQSDRNRAAEALREAESEKNVIKMKREKLDETIRKETKKLIENSVEEANEIIAELKILLEKKQLEDSDLFDAMKKRKMLENMSVEYETDSVIPEKVDNSEAGEGDLVYIKSLKNKGVLLSVSPRGEAEVRLGKLTVKVKDGDYYKIKK